MNSSIRVQHLPKSRQNLVEQRGTRVTGCPFWDSGVEYQRVALTLPEVGEVLRYADSWQVSRFAYGSLNKTRQSNLLVIYVPISSIIVVIRIHSSANVRPDYNPRMNKPIVLTLLRSKQFLLLKLLKTQMKINVFRGERN